MNTAINEKEVILPELTELIRLAQAQNMQKESQNIASLEKFLSELQTQLTALEKQIEAMNKSVEGLQDKKVKAAETNMIKESRVKLSSLKAYSQKCSNIAKSLIMDFKLKGSNAFRSALRACKVDALLREGARLSHSAAETFKYSSERTALFSKEMSGVRHSTANAVAVLAGREVTNAPKHFKNDKGLLHSIEGGFTGLSKSCDRLGSLAESLNDKLGSRFIKVDEKQKDILSSAGYKDFSPSDDKGKFICKFPADEKDNVMKLINSHNNNMKM